MNNNHSFVRSDVVHGSLGLHELRCLSCVYLWGWGGISYVYDISMSYIQSEFSAALLSLRPSSSENQGNNF